MGRFFYEGNPKNEAYRENFFVIDNIGLLSPSQSNYKDPIEHERYQTTVDFSGLVDFQPHGTGPGR